MTRASRDVVIVTGAARGLGLAISETLIASGYYVIGIGRSVTKEFRELSQEHCRFYEYDLTNISGMADLVHLVATESPAPIYALVNNAGVGLDGVLATQHASDISMVLKLNLEAPITLTKYVIRQMLRQRRGRIVNISSIIAHTGFSGLAVYGASKAGLEGFTRSLAREVGRAGITVNCVAPGYMLTDMTKSVSGPKLDSIKRRSPVGLPETHHVAHAVQFLLEPIAEKVTGSVVTVDGGSSA
jgi:3-oxoacyl-[acyl-carrier protein] reductase